MMFLIARPQGKAQQTAAAFAQASLRAKALPLLSINIAQDDALYTALHKAKPTCIIVTSTYAALWLAKALKQITLDLSGLTFVCIGTATAQLITAQFVSAQIGAKQAASPTILLASPENSEGALAMPFLQKVSTMNIVLLKGEGGRDLISSTLLQRNAKLCELNVYKRVANIPAIHALTFEPSQIKCIIATSIEITQLLLANVNQQWLMSCLWIVASQRIRDYAVTHGIHNIVVSNGASNEALIASAKQLVNTGVTRD